VAANTASWGTDAWGTNGESGAYFVITLPTGCDYCKHQQAATTGKIFPGIPTGSKGSLKYELEALPGIGSGQIQVVKSPSAVGEGFVWTVTFSGEHVQGNIPAFRFQHGIDIEDILPRTISNRHRIESFDDATIETEKKLSVSVKTVGRMGGFRARGGESFDVIGTNFGPAGTQIIFFYGPSLSAQRYSAAHCDVIVDHTKVKCVTSAGVGKSHVSLIKVGGQLSSMDVSDAAQEYSSTNIFYRPPSILSVTGIGAIGSTTAGGAQIVISGSDFGPTFTTFTQPCTFEPVPADQSEAAYLSAGARAHYGQAPNASVITGVNYAAECCVVESDERLACRTTQGTGFNHAWAVHIGGQWSTVNKAGTSYGQPIIINYENYPMQFPTDVNTYNTTGGDYITVVGKNIGFLGWKVETVSYGMLSDDELQLDTSMCTIETPHEKLVCPMAPGAGMQMTWRLVVDGQSSVYPTSAYGRPIVSGFSIDSTSILQSSIGGLNSHGGQKIIIHGQNFGPKLGALVFNCQRWNSRIC